MSYQSPTNRGAPEFPAPSAKAAEPEGPVSPTKGRPARGGDHDGPHHAGRYESPQHYRAEMPVPRSQQRQMQQQQQLAQMGGAAPQPSSGTNTPPALPEGPGEYQPAHHVAPPPPPPYSAAPPPPYDPMLPPSPHHHHHHHHGMPHHHHGHHHHHHHHHAAGGPGMPPPPPSYEEHLTTQVGDGSRHGSPYSGRLGQHDHHGSGHFGSGHGTPSGRYGTPSAGDVPAGTRFRHDPYSPGGSRVATPNRRAAGGVPMSPTGPAPN